MSLQKRQSIENVTVVKAEHLLRMVFSFPLDQLASPSNNNAHAGLPPYRGEEEKFKENSLDWIQSPGEDDYPEEAIPEQVALNWYKLIGVKPANIRAIMQASTALQSAIEAYGYTIEHTLVNSYLTILLENWPDKVDTRRNGVFTNMTGVRMALVEIEFGEFITNNVAGRKKLELCAKIKGAKIWSSRRSKRLNLLHLMEIIKQARIEMGRNARLFLDPLLLCIDRCVDVLSVVEPRFKMRFNRFDVGIPYRWSLIMNSREQRTKKERGLIKVTAARRMDNNGVQAMLVTNLVIGNYRADNEPEARDLPPGWEQVGEWDDAQEEGPAFPDASNDLGIDGDVWENELSFPVEEPGQAALAENEFIRVRVNDTYISEYNDEERIEMLEQEETDEESESDESSEMDSRETVTEIVYIPEAEIRPVVTRYRPGYHPGTDRRLSQ